MEAVRAMGLVGSMAMRSGGSWMPQPTRTSATISPKSIALCIGFGLEQLICVASIVLVAIKTKPYDSTPPAVGDFRPFVIKTNQIQSSARMLQWLPRNPDA